jgi:hypothetical protein
MALRYGVAAAVLTAGLGMAAANASQYLVNGGFDTGDFTGWTLTDPSGFTTVEPSSFAYGAQSGAFYVYAGPPSTAPGVLSQSFADVAGQNLTVTGWAIGDTNIRDGLGSVSYYLDGVFLGSPDLSQGIWTESVFNVAATGNDTFSIRFYNDNSYNGLDTFSVTNGATTVPEIPVWSMLLLGFAGLSFSRRRPRSLVSAV